MSRLLSYFLKSTFSNPVCTRNISISSFHFKQAIDYSKVPILKEEDLEESFIKGSGPGGQNVNKRNNCVLLKHKPTGIVVKTHESRLLDTNRKLARGILTERLDHLFNGEESVACQKKRIEEKKNNKSDAKRRKLQELKAAWKERENENVGEVTEDKKTFLSASSPIVFTKRYKSTSLDYSKVPKLNESELEEQIIRGSGTHKVTNCILLIHKPTGIVVKGTKSRILSENRTIAREILIEKLDEKINGEDSLAGQRRQIENKKSSSREFKRKKMQQLKANWKEANAQDN